MAVSGMELLVDGVAAVVGVGLESVWADGHCPAHQDCRVQ